jgi:hypothetical protein
MSPFFVNYGFHPCFLAEFTSTNVPATDEFAARMHQVHERLVENVTKAQDIQARYYDCKHKPVEFKPRELVWLNASNISTTCPSKKLDRKRLEPFKVVKRIELQAYELDLPMTMRHIHNVFHISLLNPYKSTPIALHSLLPPLPPLYIKDN